jgi:hypothetical protein
MAGFELTEWIQAVPAEVMAFATNPDNAPKVSHGVQKMEQLPDGPLQVGTQYRETRLMNGRPATTELEVTTYDEASGKYSVTSELSGISVTYHYTFKPENGGTRINLVCETVGKGLKKAVVPVVVQIMKKEDGDHLQQLKAAMAGKSAP